MLFRSNHGISIWYHSAILDIFRPFIPPEKQCCIRIYSSNVNPPEAIFSASLRLLKKLVIVFLENQESADYSMFWHIALLQVANSALNDTSDPEWRFYFTICIRGYQKLLGAYRFAEPIARGLLSMALRNGALTSLEAYSLHEEVLEAGRHHEQLKRIQSKWKVDLNLAITDSKAAQADTLADQFEQLAIFNEFTNSEVDKTQED
jgi:hypothetical protein